MKTVVSILLGVATGLSLFFVMHKLVDQPPQFIDPIVKVFELPMREVPVEPENKIERSKPPVRPESVKKGVAVARRASQIIEFRIEP